MLEATSARAGAWISGSPTDGEKGPVYDLEQRLYSGVLTRLEAWRIHSCNSSTSCGCISGANSVVVDEFMCSPKDHDMRASLAAQFWRSECHTLVIGPFSSRRDLYQTLTVGAKLALGTVMPSRGASISREGGGGLFDGVEP